jgi:hypothetical protein
MAATAAAASEDDEEDEEEAWRLCWSKGGEMRG